jgi:N-sulfoglucosamine sulfohydrolase
MRAESGHPLPTKLGRHRRDGPLEAHGRGLARLLVAALLLSTSPARAADPRPNILVAISDDQSWVHASAYGDVAVATPAFDRVAREGALFTQAFSPTPGCSPTRAAFLTGRHSWMIEQAGTHASSFPRKYAVWTDTLEKSGYVIGATGKLWGPGNWEVSGWQRNPVGPAWQTEEQAPPAEGVSRNDYAANFVDFLEQRPRGRPFVFWYGASEPHRPFTPGMGLRSGKRLEDAVVPPFLPDRPEVRSDLLDYACEIEWFDRHLGRMLAALEKEGELANTLVIVTSDNGMAFPRAKANIYEYGVHVPLAIMWPARMPGGRTIDDLIGFVDITATILDVAGVEHPSKEYPLAGRSFKDILLSTKQGVVDARRDAVYVARERHSSARFNSLGYPQRGLRTHEHLYIRNFTPERWPAGAPQKYGTGSYAKAKDVVARSLGPRHEAYHDIDDSPTLRYLIEHREDPSVAPFLHLAVDKRPAEELYDVRRDPGCLENLATDPDHAETTARLRERLLSELGATGDPRVTADADVWETYPRYSPLRWFPTPPWAVDHPERVPHLEWLEERRPR